MTVIIKLKNKSDVPDDVWKLFLIFGVNKMCMCVSECRQRMNFNHKINKIKEWCARWCVGKLFLIFVVNKMCVCKNADKEWMWTYSGLWT